MARSTDSTPSSSDVEVNASEDMPNYPGAIRSSAPEVSATQSDGPSEKKENDRWRSTRPKLVSRVSSSIIVPRSQANPEDEQVEYPPGDARAMSPRRNSEETEKIEEETRSVVREYVFMNR